MISNAILMDYQSRIVTLHASASQLRIGQMLALAVLVIALCTVVLIGYLSLTRKTVRLPAALIPLPLIIYSGKTWKQRNIDLLRTLRRLAYYEQGRDRLEGKWTKSDHDGEEFSREHHKYQNDLGVIGKGSLFQLLCTCRTQAGRKRLAEYLLDTPTVDEIRDRQQAVAELQDDGDLREKISLLGEFSFQEANWNTVVNWVGSPVGLVMVWQQLLLAATSGSLAVCLLLGISSAVTWGHLAIPIGLLLALSTGFGVGYRTRVLASRDAVRHLGSEIGILRQGVELIGSRRFVSSLLVRLSEASRDCNPNIYLRRLERLTRILSERDKEWFYAFSRVLSIGTQTFLLIESWRIRHGGPLRRWLEAWGEFEALMAVATYAYEHPENTFPQLESDEVVFKAEAVGNPLLQQRKSVPNDVLLDRHNRFYIISGSNMAGKSTFLRTIGLNCLLAYAGAPVVAKNLVLSRFTICASLGIRDSLLDGKSKFLAEIDRVKQALTVPLEDRPMLFLIDEIFAGTNSTDRKTVAKALIKAFIDQGALGAVSTHDLALTEIAEVPQLWGANVHMASNDENDPLHFDYSLKPGVTTRSSALAIAKLAGLIL